MNKQLWNYIGLNVQVLKIWGLNENVEISGKEKHRWSLEDEM